MAKSGEKEVKREVEMDTRRRLLDTGEELFSRRGYKTTSVRKLADAAECNLAAVNYHFGGKDKLYFEVWHRLLVQLRQVRLESIRKVMSQSDREPSLEELLRAFAESFVGPFADQSRSDRLIKLMVYEMLDQHLPANMFIEDVIKPTMSAMRDALMKLCPGLDESRIPLLIFSIVGQLLHMIRVKSMLGQKADEQMLKLDIDMDEAIEHIVKFSAAGIGAFAEGKTK